MYNNLKKLLKLNTNYRQLLREQHNGRIYNYKIKNNYFEQNLNCKIINFTSKLYLSKSSLFIK